jgi:hypothetical protein
LEKYFSFWEQNYKKKEQNFSNQITKEEIFSVYGRNHDTKGKKFRRITNKTHGTKV